MFCFVKTALFSILSLQANLELGGIWAVGQRIWQRDFPGIYTTIDAYQWSESIQPIMEALKGKHFLVKIVRIINHERK